MGDTKPALVVNAQGRGSDDQGETRINAPRPLGQGKDPAGDDGVKTDEHRSYPHDRVEPT